MARRDPIPFRSATRRAPWAARRAKFPAPAAAANSSEVLASNQRGHRSEPDDVRQRTDLALLVFAQLEQQRHRYRFQLLHLAPLGIDRRAGSSGIGLAGGGDFSRNGAQGVFDAGPVLLLRRRKF